MTEKIVAAAAERDWNTIEYVLGKAKHPVNATNKIVVEAIRDGPSTLQKFLALSKVHGVKITDEVIITAAMEGWTTLQQVLCHSRNPIRIQSEKAMKMAIESGSDIIEYFLDLVERRQMMLTTPMVERAAQARTSSLQRVLTEGIFSFAISRSIIDLAGRAGPSSLQRVFTEAKYPYKIPGTTTMAALRLGPIAAQQFVDAAMMRSISLGKEVILEAIQQGPDILRLVLSKGYENLVFDQEMYRAVRSAGWDTVVVFSSSPYEIVITEEASQTTTMASCLWPDRPAPNEDDVPSDSLCLQLPPARRLVYSSCLFRGPLFLSKSTALALGTSRLSDLQVIDGMALIATDARTFDRIFAGSRSEIDLLKAPQVYLDKPAFCGPIFRAPSATDQCSPFSPLQPLEKNNLTTIRQKQYYWIATGMGRQLGPSVHSFCTVLPSCLVQEVGNLRNQSGRAIEIEIPCCLPALSKETKANTGRVKYTASTKANDATAVTNTNTFSLA
ncbi:hypothetical protein ACJZ2D_011230 [Fusarium nematophilum]